MWRGYDRLIVRMSVLVTALLALALTATVLGGVAYLGLLSLPGGVPTASNTPRPSFVVGPSVAPTATPVVTAAPTPVPTPQPTPGGTYVVQPGDFLTAIAAKYGIPWQLIATANNIPGPDYKILVGQTLIIPTLPQPTDGSQVYVVQPGDNITKIATQFSIDPTDLADFNNLADWNSIHPGDILYIPGPGWTPLPTPSG